MTTRKISPYFDKEIKDTVRWSLLQGDDPSGFVSVYFDGTGDYLSIADNAALEMGSGDFTIECFFNMEVFDSASLSNLINKTGTLEFGYGIHVSTASNIVARWSTDGINTTDIVGSAVTTNQWYHVALTRSGNNFTLWLNGSNVGTNTTSGSLFDGNTTLAIGANSTATNTFQGWIANVRIVKGTALYTAPFQIPTNILKPIAGTSLLTCADITFKDRSSNNFTVTANGNAAIQGKSPYTADFLNLLDEGVAGGSLFSQAIISTYSLVYTGTSEIYVGGILAPNGDIHFIPRSGVRGQKINSSGVVSTYSLVYTSSNAYAGGVLAPNGDIHFVPNSANRGQKINSSGVVSTYSLIYTATAAYFGGVLAPNGDIHFVPRSANRGQKISVNGVVSTYSLIYTVTTGYGGGVLAQNGDIHFIPFSANRGQKISVNGVVSTYSLIYSVTTAYNGGVLAPNGDIHFVPWTANRGQKISASGVVSTYSLVYTTTQAYSGGVVAPNGDIHFVPSSAIVGQKISADGVVSTYSLIYTATNAYGGGVLTPNGDIHFIPNFGVRGTQLNPNTGVVFSKGIAMSPFYNKF